MAAAFQIDHVAHQPFVTFNLLDKSSEKKEVGGLVAFFSGNLGTRVSTPAPAGPLVQTTLAGQKRLFYVVADVRGAHDSRGSDD